MDGEDFRDLRVAAGLSVRAAAKALGVAPSSVQRWESDARIPSEIAEQMQSLVGIPSRLVPSHTLGHLTAVLSNVIYGYTPQQFTSHVQSGTRTTIGHLMQRAIKADSKRYAELEPQIQELLAGLDNYPEMMSDEMSAEFWRGYYSRRQMLEDQAKAQVL